ncbi:pyridoxine/pyridoxamine 5'-phosphate oxidase 1, chloroplastic isoform X2 [Pyrus x bretschneideri]|uniref:pyridoxine/pyridoxamine 5'-phosphate oxidase 1, chloroplastic isoform X2 n=1 Tax=Pyrus x bretschneideri TaxID=225117 RepID=UPI00202E3914|nr:pyridoxine/pyridoxamine 5'-phosphate oxidase 1, chloroplastic isoform X2 [Pyrus x bretschneideri]
MLSLARKTRIMTRVIFLTQFGLVTQSLTSNPISNASTSFYNPLSNVSAFLQPVLSPAIHAFCSNPSSAAGVGSVGAVPSMQNPEDISYLTQREAAEIDEILMGPLGFSVDQLMELAGLSVATSIAELESLSVPFISVEDLPLDLSKDFDIIVDAMFGFSFHGSPRPPFDNLIQKLVCVNKYDQTREKSSVIVSVDIPSGWHVEGGGGVEGIKPDMLVSLTAPKLCAKKFFGPHHFLGGRFVPPSIADKYKLRLPPYPGTSMCVRIGRPPQVDISALRENYISPEFLEEQVEADPFDQFRKWFDDVVAAGLREPNAMALSTATKNGKISSRMVLLKGFDKNGFVWYTNYESRKAHELSENPRASLLFYWDGLNRQVRVEGSVQKVSDEESDQYFHSRPRGSQIGAIVSKQSTVVPGRHVLYDQYKELEEKFSDGSLIPKPKNWGGYRLKPELFEFWQGQKSRLHDRLRYSPEEINGQQVWKIERLAP